MTCGPGIDPQWYSPAFRGEVATIKASAEFRAVQDQIIYHLKSHGGNSTCQQMKRLGKSDPVTFTLAFGALVTKQLVTVDGEKVTLRHIPKAPPTEAPGGLPLSKFLE